MIIKHFFDREGWHRGGFTVVHDTAAMNIGIALCSDKDQYSKKEGVRVATQRADIPGFPTDDEAPVVIVVPRTNGKMSYLLDAAISNAIERARKFHKNSDISICFVGG